MRNLFLSPNVLALLEEMETNMKTKEDVAYETKVCIATITRYLGGTRVSRSIEKILMLWVSDSKEARNGK